MTAASEQHDTTERVMALVRAAASDDAGIGPDSELLTTGVLDSLSVMRLVASLEQVFDTRIPMLDLTIENLSSGAAIAQMMDRLRPQ